jgi:hypothetical protein
VTPSILAKPIESQPAEITQLFFSQPLRIMPASMGTLLLPIKTSTSRSAMIRCGAFAVVSAAFSPMSITCT